MKGFVGVTDKDWFDFLSQQQEIDEVNFWQPGGKSSFKALSAGEPFFFKLHSPNNYIVGGGFFAHSTILPISLAWQTFQEKNGVQSILEMRRRTEKYRKDKPATFEDYNIGCILLTQPFFFPSNQWIPIPPDFHLNIVQGKTYDLTKGHGLNLWENVKGKLENYHFKEKSQLGIVETGARYGEPVTILPRLGQGSFRILVTDKYERRCAITREKTLPVLEAAHIKPYGESGPHSIQNGILLRADIHKLFDTGYVTVTKDHRFEVSKRIDEEFHNGKFYYNLHGHKIYVPADQYSKPSEEFLSWHNENRFRG